MASLSHAADLLYNAIQTGNRDGSTYYLSSDAPSWARNIIWDAHDGELPNDSRYRLIQNALSSIAEGGFNSADDAEEEIHCIAADLVPCAITDLLEWYREIPARVSAADEAIEDIELTSLIDILSAGCQRTAEETVSCLIASLEEKRFCVFNPDTDAELLLSGGFGRYIPQLYCSDIEQADCSLLSVYWDDVLDCQAGPEGEHYWEAWENITSSLRLSRADGDWILFQDGDLWMVRADVEIPEEWAS